MQYLFLAVSKVFFFFFKVRVEEDRVTFRGVARYSVRNGFSA